jgi:protein-S-isoprenylcysteine O-methyltransferase Ste14
VKATYFIKLFLGTFLFFTIIFISAGHLDYWPGLIYVIIGLIMFVLSHTVFRLDPELLEERAKAGEGTKKWDKNILLLSFVMTISMYVTAGLDSGRYHWSPDFHWSLILLGIIMTISGQLLFLIAQKQNKFFSSTVRIQTNREHKVCDTGLYKMVRHPAYLGSIIQTLGFPLLFASLWSLIPIFLLLILLITRTSMEDKTLQDELKGYAEYSQKTRYKIIPFVW